MSEGVEDLGVRMGSYIQGPIVYSVSVEKDR